MPRPHGNGHLALAPPRVAQQERYDALLAGSRVQHNVSVGNAAPTMAFAVAPGVGVSVGVFVSMVVATSMLMFTCMSMFVRVLVGGRHTGCLFRDPGRHRVPCLFPGIKRGL